MKISILLCLSAACVTMPLKTQAADVATNVTFYGECYISTGGQQPSKCAGIVYNTRYLDGFDNFQFRSLDAGTGVATQGQSWVFAGAGWKTNKLGGPAAQLPDNVSFMTIRESKTLDFKTKKFGDNPIREGQCVVESRQGRSRSFADIETIKCEYNDRRGVGHTFALRNIVRFDDVKLVDFGSYN